MKMASGPKRFGVKSPPTNRSKNPLKFGSREKSTGSNSRRVLRNFFSFGGAINIFGDKRNPYYIWAPRWIDVSAGVRCIHYLCHSLNVLGYSAYLVFFEKSEKVPRVNPRLRTPILTQEIVDAHRDDGMTPIIVYPEDVIGNPLNGSFVVRFLWNFVGALGGPQEFDEDEFMLAFSEVIAADYASRTDIRPRVLFVPPIDPTEITPNFEKKPFQLIYAGKYRSFVGKPHKVGGLPSVEIFRSGPRMQSREQVKKLLSDASVLYSFENSSIVTEAILSGTPAGFIPNKFLGKVIAQKELGMGGTFVGDSPDAIELARQSLQDGIDAYHRTVEGFERNLRDFAEETQFLASSMGANTHIQVPEIHGSVTTNRVKLAGKLLLHKGPIVLAREIFRFLRSRR